MADSKFQINQTVLGNPHPENSYPSKYSMENSPSPERFPPRKLSYGIFPPISLIVFLHLINRVRVYMYILLPGQKILISPGLLRVFS